MQIKKVIRGLADGLFGKQTVSYVLDALRKQNHFCYRFHVPYRKILYVRAVVKEANRQDISLEQFTRIVRSLRGFVSSKPCGLWEGIYLSKHQNTLKLLSEGDILNLWKMLANPLDNDLLYGFDNMAKSLNSMFRIESRLEPALTADHFFALGEFCGVVRLSNPECNTRTKDLVDINSVIDNIIRQRFHCQFNFPNPFKGERGIKTDFGIASQRVPSAIYQAFRLMQLGTKFCEIGGGLGRTAYFTRLLGAHKYTLVDIPLTTLTQAYFLCRSLTQQDDFFQFEGEEDIRTGICFLSPESFLLCRDSYDVTLNVDSLTELSESTAQGYLRAIRRTSRYFLSINHEQNTHSVRDLCAKQPDFREVSQCRSWIRPGYVESLYEICS